MIVSSTAAVTVKAAVPDIDPDVAVMVEAPMATPVARPWLPGELDTVAADVFDEDHVTELVRSTVLRSE